jgi:HSP20 family molecular chaperone IbpA
LDAPYARIPPEVDREEHVIRQAAMFYEKIRELTTPAPGASSSVSQKPMDARPDQSFVAPVIPALFTVVGKKDEIRYVFELAGVPKDRVNVELQGTNLRIFGDRPSLGAESDSRLNPTDFPKMRLERTVTLPLPVDPTAVTANFTDGLLTVRVRMPSADDQIHKIEVR